jgi:hypothetical protein
MKPWQSHALVALTCLLAGFGYGRFIQPQKKVTVDHSEEVTRLQQLVASLRLELETFKRHTVKETTITYSPTTAKPVTKTVKEDTHVDKVSSVATDVKINTDATAAKLVDHTVIQTSRPDWELSVMGGVSLTNFTDPWSSGSWKFVAGAHLQRRIAGPFKAGAWVIGGAGILSGGLSLGMEF